MYKYIFFAFSITRDLAFKIYRRPQDAGSMQNCAEQLTIGHNLLMYDTHVHVY